MLRRILYNDGASPAGAAYGWGMLVLIFLLIAWNFDIHFRYPSSTWQQLGRGLIVPLMLLFNHLASAFRWPGFLGFAMNVLSVSWVIIGCILVFWFP